MMITFSFISFCLLAFSGEFLVISCILTAFKKRANLRWMAYVFVAIVAQALTLLTCGVLVNMMGL